MDNLASASGTPRNEDKQLVLVRALRAWELLAYLYLTVETTGPPEGRVDRIRSIRGGDDDDTPGID